MLWEVSFRRLVILRATSNSENEGLETKSAGDRVVALVKYLLAHSLLARYLGRSLSVCFQPTIRPRYNSSISLAAVHAWSGTVTAARAILELSSGPPEGGMTSASRQFRTYRR